MNRETSKRGIQLAGAISGYLLVMFALKGCSPLASSIEKGGKEGFGPTISSNTVHILTWRSLVRSDRTSDTVRDGVTAGTRVLTLSPQQVATFQNSGSLTLLLSQPVLPRLAVGVFRVTLSDDEIAQSGLSSFESSFELSSVNPRQWTLSSNSSAAQQVVSQLVREHLVSIDIVLSFDGEAPAVTLDGVVGEPAPLQSAVPSPVPSSEPSATP